MANLDYINRLSHISLILHEMANKNLDQLAGKCQEKHEMQDYYLGILRREAMVCHDLHLILKNRPQENLTTIYVLLRSLLDDFIHLVYLDLHDNPTEEIIKINAKSHKEHFESLAFLTNSKHQENNGESMNYLTAEGLEEVKTIFKSKEENKKYFTKINEFEFKRFIQLRQVAEKINGTNTCNIARDRAYYLWKDFSSFVHYANWCFEYELTEDIIKLQVIEESLQYVFNSILIAFKYFKQTFGIKTIITRYLIEEIKFGIIITKQEKK